MHERQEFAGPFRLLLWIGVEEQAPRQGIVFGGDQGRGRWHGLGIAVGDCQRLRLADRGEADKADGPATTADGQGQGVVGLVTGCIGSQRFALAAQDQFLEGVVGTGLVIASVQLDGSIGTAELTPVGDLA